jgi:hypothetical protein
MAGFFAMSSWFIIMSQRTKFVDKAFMTLRASFNKSKSVGYFTSASQQVASTFIEPL